MISQMLSRLSRTSPRPPGRADRARLAARRRSVFMLEGLETRQVLSTISWTGEGADALWSNAENWSGNVVPGANDTAVISSAAATVRVSSDASVGFLQLDAGTVSVNSGATLGIAKNLKVGAGATLDGDGGVTFGGADHGGATINAAATASIGNLTFNKTTPGANFTLSGTLTVGGGLTVSGANNINGGRINVGGNVKTTDTTVFGTTVIYLDGAHGISGDGALPSVEVAGGATTVTGDLHADYLTVSGGVLNAGKLGVSHNLTVSGGTFNASALTFDGGDHGKATIDAGASTSIGSLTFNKTTAGANFTLSGTLAVVNGLTVSGANNINGGQIEVGGNVETTDTTVSGTTVIYLNGAHGISGCGALPSVEVAGGATTVTGDLQVNSLTISGGTFKAPAGTLGIRSNFTRSGSGVFNANGGTVAFNQNNHSNVDIGNTSLNNVILDKSVASASLFIASGSSLKINGNLAIDGISSINGAKGAITVAGNLSSSDSSVGGTADITMVGGNASLTGADFPNGGIKIDKSSLATVTASMTQPLDGKLVIQNLKAIEGTLLVGNGVTTYVPVSGGGVIEFAGAGTQTLAAATDVGGLPSVRIDTTGTLNIDTANPIAVSGSWWWEKGAFNAAGSTIKFTGRPDVWNPNLQVETGGAGQGAFGNVEIAMIRNDGDLTVMHMQVNGNLTLTNARFIKRSSIIVKGDVTTSDTLVRPLEGGNIQLYGTTDQTIRATKDGARIPALFVNKPMGAPLGKLIIDSTHPIDIAGNWTYRRGKVDAGASTIRFVDTATVKTASEFGSMQFNNVDLAMGNRNLTVESMAVNGKLTLTEVNAIVDGAIIALGDVVTNAAGASSINGGAIEFAGDGTQSITTGTVGARLPGVTINKPSGSTLILPAEVNVAGGWLVASTNRGAVNTNGGTVNFVGSKLGFIPGGVVIDTGSGAAARPFNNVNVNMARSDGDLNVTKMAIDGALTLTNVRNIYAASGAITVVGDLISNDDSVGGTADITMAKGPDPVLLKGGDFPSGGIIIAKAGGSRVITATMAKALKGPLVFAGVAGVTINGDVPVAGDVTVNVDVRGAGRFIFEGGANQKLTMVGSLNAGINGAVINKSVGKLTLVGNANDSAKPLNVYGDWIVTDTNKGTVDASGATVVFANTGTVNTGGDAAQKPMAFQNVKIDMGSTTAILTVQDNGKLAINGNLEITNRNRIINGPLGAITVGGNLTRTGGGTSIILVGTADITMVGNKDATISSDWISNPNGRPAFPVSGIVIAKTGGKTVSLDSDLSVVPALKVQSGTLNFGNKSMVVGGPMSVANGAKLVFQATGSTQLTISKGDLTFESGSNLAVDLAAVSAEYDLIEVTGAGKKLNNNGVNATSSGNPGFTLDVPSGSTTQGKVRVVSVV